jgi:hypothetical protein
MNETPSKLAKIGGCSRTVVGILMALAFAGALVAQCPNNSTHFTGEAERGNPFQAVFVQTTIFPSITRANVMIERKYRDSYGRVRSEVYTKAASSEPEMHRIGEEDFAGVESTLAEVPPGLAPNFISIEDPCSLKHYLITPGAKTVKIQGRQFNQGPYCTGIPWASGEEIPGSSVFGPGVRQWRQIEVLAHRSLAGVDSRGMRISIFTSLEDKQNGGVAIYSDEQWCSEELGIDTGRFEHLSGQKIDRKRVLKHLVRLEPDAALFKIPSDFARIELDSNGNPMAQPKPSAKEAPKRD